MVRCIPGIGRGTAFGGGLRVQENEETHFLDNSDASLRPPIPKHSMKSLLFVLLALFVASTRGVASAPQRPNFVVFVVDDMGIMDTSVAFLIDESGHPRRYPLNDFYRTPNMMRLACSGIRFNQFYAMSVCSPTRVSLMTGQNAARHRTTNWIDPDHDNTGPHGAPDWNWRGLKSDDVTLAGLLQDQGYRTIHIGKGHFGPRGTKGADPANLGFDINVAGASFGSPATYYGTANYGNAGEGNETPAPHAVPHLEQYHGTQTFLTEALTIEAKAQVADAVKAGQPFFLHFAHYAAHAPFDEDSRFSRHYLDSGKSPPARAFASLIEGVDHSLGDVLDHLRSLGVAENTLVVFLGDNGSDAPLGNPHDVACAAPLRGKKGTHYEGGMRVPCIVAWGATNTENQLQCRLPIPANVIQTQVASVCDLFPTILALSGGEPPPAHIVDGRRLNTLLTGKPDATRPATFLMHYPHAPHNSDYWTSFRDGPWKVVYHYWASAASGNSHYQLFNLAVDPFEQKNLAEAEPQELRRMVQCLIAELVAHNAAYPLDDDGKSPRMPKLP